MVVTANDMDVIGKGFAQATTGFAARSPVAPAPQVTAEACQLRASQVRARQARAARLWRGRATAGPAERSGAPMSAAASKPVPPFKDRLAWDSHAGEILDETRRYMLIRPEALMGIFRNLPDEARVAALNALEDSIFEQGSDSARAYRRHGGEGASLAHLVAATAPQLGWGIWHFEIAPEVIRLEVRNSPFAAGFGPSPTPVCHAIVGMVGPSPAWSSMRPVNAAEIQCAATGAPTCRFEARPIRADTKVSDPS